ncbi:MAG TPA: tail fiber domain-containing protein [Bacteroidota bacterium]|nr:tail fiber domain-containing protein [Bacteroidota bacterium]
MKNYFVLFAFFVTTLSTIAYNQERKPFLKENNPMIRPQAAASFPRTMSYQGLLITSKGLPAPNGGYDLQFDLYDSLTGGSSQWTEIHIAVPVQQGSFSVILGSTTPLSVDFNRKLYAEVRTLNGPTGPSYPFTFSPRTELASAPYSLGPWITSPIGDIYTWDKVGIGTSTPNSALTVVGNSAFFAGVGIGTATPGERLTVAGSMEIGTGAGDYQHLRIGGGNSSGFLYGSYAKYGDGIHLGYNYYADAAGNGVIANAGGAASRLSLGYGYIGLYVGAVNGDPYYPSVYINGGGEVGIGTDAPGYRLQVGNSGDGSQARANAWNTFSDRRLKKNIRQIDNALEKVMRLRGVNFTWVKSGEPSIGFIAQEVEEVLPDIVSTDRAGYKSLDYGKITPLLVEAIKQQQKEIEELEKLAKSLGSEKIRLGEKSLGELK